MNASVRVIQRSLDTLDSRGRFAIGALVAAQTAVAVISLVGIMLVGLAVTAVTNSSTESSASGLGSRLTDLLRLDASSPDKALVLAGLGGCLLLLTTAMTYFITRATFRFMANRQAALSVEIMGRIMRRTWVFAREQSSQEVSWVVIHGTRSVALGILAQSVVLASEVVLLVTLGIGLAVLEPAVTLATFLFFLLVAFVLHRLLSRWAHQIGVRNKQTDVDSLETIQEGLRSFREISISGRVPFFMREFGVIRRDGAQALADSFLLGMSSKYVFDAALVVGGGLLVVSQAASRGFEAALPVVAVFLIAASRMTPSLLRLQTALFNIKVWTSQAEGTFALMDRLSDEESRAPAETEVSSQDLERRVVKILERPPGDFVPVLRVANVTARYPNSATAALLDVSITVEEGESIAVVGPTGAGKSTLADVVLGQMDPERGTVLLSGMPIRDTLARWPGLVAYVPQEATLVNGTVRDNVALGLPREVVDDEQVWEALAQSKLEPFFRSERDGLETLVGEHGTRLSGGQRQRLGIARALYSRPRFLVLDEATSALDAETEAAIAATIGALAASTTQMVIAHRLATVVNCSRVIYIDRGRIVAAGTFEEVRSTVPAFDKQAGLLGL